MPTQTYGASFKPVTYSSRPFSRPPSPEQPIEHIEPLSPGPSVQDTPFLQFMREVRQNAAASQTTHASNRGGGRAWRKSISSYGDADSSHRRNSSNTIAELAQVALSAGHSPLIHPQTRPSTGHSQGTAFSQHERVWTSTQPSSSSSDRLQKRSWSAAQATSQNGTSHAQTRYSLPSSSMPRDMINEPELAAAELLLNFAGQAPKVYPARTFYQLPYPQDRRAQDPPRQESNASSYLPSPRTSSGEIRFHHHEGSPTGDPTGVMEDVEHTGVRSVKQASIQRPPEEETHEIPNQAEIYEDTEIKEERTKGRRGWPKGKPRGSKKSMAGAGVTKSKPAGNRRGRKSAATRSVEPPSPPRRASLSDLPQPSASPSMAPSRRACSVPPSCRFVPGKQKSNAGRKPYPKFTKETVCESCNISRVSLIGEMDQWISCNGCKKWFHSDCAGFPDERELKDVDKFFCPACEPEHGATTFVRKSGRAHTAVDYAGLNQGVLKTSDDCYEHHYIQPIKDGKLFTWDEEDFPRMPPELVTAEYFERSACFDRPIVIPAALNPKPGQRLQRKAELAAAAPDGVADLADEIVLLPDFEYDTVYDDGQDKLDMVIPQDLTVRRVCDLIGSEFPLPVIDTKAQGEGGRWNMGKWADYYETDGKKPIRNVISLEVSNTKLGRLLRRPRVVRQIDLQENVWPKDDPQNSVGFYCLMSVADSFTDFHIDFGGSSVYYHILRGSKTFFFIPPTSKHLKAYEEWNNMPAQHHTFLAHMTDECYRVDLFEGDTMLIPSGWIHAVWTPSTSLVIGGNFLTKMHYDMQFKVVEIEKANKTALKFRYPKFQKVMWYSVLKYLREDPLPDEVREIFYSGEKFRRDVPAWQEFEDHGALSALEPQHRNTRYYSQMELDGLPNLVSFIFRTVMIAKDRLDNISVQVRKAVVASIPKGYGDPLDIVQSFALWVAWKRGNEDPPKFAHPDFALPDKEGNELKKLSDKMLKLKQRQEAFEAYKMAPERQSERQKVQESNKQAASAVKDQFEVGVPPAASAATVSPKSTLGPRRVACDTCRRRRIRCKHKDEMPTSSNRDNSALSADAGHPGTAREFVAVVIPRQSNDQFLKTTPTKKPPQSKSPAITTSAAPFTPGQDHLAEPQALSTPQTHPGLTQISGGSTDASIKRSRTKACAECRKSKRRCVHDENGNIDPVKEKQLPVPRGSVTKKRKPSGDDLPDTKRPKLEVDESESTIFQMQLSSQQVQAHETANDDLMVDPQLLADSALPGPDASDSADGSQQGISFDEFAAQATDYSNLAQAGKSPVDATQDSLMLDPALSADNQQADLPSAPVHAADADGRSDTTPKSSSHSTGESDGNSSKATSTDLDGDEQDLQKRDIVTEQAEIGERSVATSVDGNQQPLNLAATMQSAAVPSVEWLEDDVSQQQKTSKGHTPSFNEPPSLSSASSPLSMADNSPEPLATPVMKTIDSSVRQSARHGKPVERFANSHFEGSKLSSGLGTTMSVGSRKRRRDSTNSIASSGQPRHGAVAVKSEGGSPKLKRQKASGRAKDRVTSKFAQTEPRRDVEDRDTSEDESLRLARELTEESFGLRRRKSLGA